MPPSPHRSYTFLRTLPLSLSHTQLVDFGVACDLFTQKNFVRDLQPFDPNYSPPEAPPEEGGLVVTAGGKFDVYSAGLILMQMCFRSYRSDQGIAQFKRNLALQGFDMRKWRRSVEGTGGFDEGLKILDDYGGFSLLEGCFKRNANARISSAQAASSRFCLLA